VERVTHYQSAQTLTVDLPATDLANLSLNRLTVVNNAPGGGTSVSLDVPVGYGVPQITSLTPEAIPAPSVFGTAMQSIFITGTGFVPQSIVRSGSEEYATTFLSSTRLGVGIPNYVFVDPGVRQFAVNNPGPGGGTSNALDFSVNYPVPAIAMPSPDSSFVGAAFTLTVTGAGFGPGSRVQWNGQDRPTTYVSRTQITAAIPVADVGNPATVLLAVRNPTPGGGTSSNFSYRIVEQPPAITAVNPGSVTAGAGSTTITITGTNFRAGATAQWNGANRSATLVNGTSMTMTLTAADVATPQTGKVTVANPGASGISNAMGVVVATGSPSLAVDRTVTLTHADLVYDSVRKVLYASVPTTAGQYANEIVRIDPTSGAVTGEVSVGSNPNALAITDDGQYLYVGAVGAPRVYRIALATLTRDLDIPLQGDAVSGPRYAEDIQPIPGAPKRIAVSTFFVGASPRNAGTFLFDDATPLPVSGPAEDGANRLTRGPGASRVYGYDSETIGHDFRSLIVAADGLHEETLKPGFFTSYGLDIEYDGDFVYATDGEVASVPAMTKVGTIPMTGSVRPDASNARVHFLNGNSIYTYHYTTFASLGSFSDASLASHTKLVRWGTDGLAVGGGATIVLLRGGLVAP
jgi:hypothetical protein